MPSFGAEVRDLLGGRAFSMCYDSNRIARCQATHTPHPWGLGRILKGPGNFSASCLTLEKAADASEEVRVFAHGQSWRLAYNGDIIIMNEQSPSPLITTLLGSP